MSLATMERAKPARSLLPKDSTIHVRAPQKTRDLIARAAEMSNQTLTTFILESATRHAIDVLLDQRLFVLDEDQYEQFVSALDNAPEPSEGLKKMMSSKAPWEI